MKADIALLAIIQQINQVIVQLTAEDYQNNWQNLKAIPWGNTFGTFWSFFNALKMVFKQER
ncbi:MAG: hypothetical protein IPM36_04450 [Lewinellaceae bacterium]|nr:hypothetical protein [Lewinellaceae bacterium]